jgi:hypothetical protein
MSQSFSTKHVISNPSCPFLAMVSPFTALIDIITLQFCLDVSLWHIPSLVLAICTPDAFWHVTWVLAICPPDTFGMLPPLAVPFFPSLVLIVCAPDVSHWASFLTCFSLPYSSSWSSTLLIIFPVGCVCLALTVFESFFIMSELQPPVC